MYFFLFISIHIAAAVVASRDSEEVKGGVPKRINSDPAARQKKAKATPDGRKKKLTNFTTEIFE